jgi:secondary thiamine-phosphate synthase enzyme
VAWLQREIRLRARPRGFHLVTEEILQQLPELREFEVGLAHFFIQHTSAALALNENADPTVRADLERALTQVAPENAPYYEHTSEGPDDMPAHVKAVLLGSSVTVPIRHGRLALGTWQGIYLCEFRNRGGERRLVATLHGDRTGA